MPCVLYQSYYLSTKTAMFKKITLLNCLIALFTSTHAQSLSPTVIASAGGSDRTSLVRLDWTLGELAVETASISHGMYTQGFHQPILIIESQTSPFPFLSSDYTVNVFPNPVTSILNITLNSKKDNKVVLRLTDFKGRTIYTNTAYSKGSSVRVNLNGYSSGVYLLFITTSSGAIISTYKIVKAS
jgi:hypothetical protein